MRVGMRRCTHLEGSSLFCCYFLNPYNLCLSLKTSSAVQLLYFVQMLILFFTNLPHSLPVILILLFAHSKFCFRQIHPFKIDILIIECQNLYFRFSILQFWLKSSHKMFIAMFWAQTIVAKNLSCQVACPVHTSSSIAGAKILYFSHLSTLSIRSS